jgi:hypothetical protein
MPRQQKRHDNSVFRKHVSPSAHSPVPARRLSLSANPHRLTRDDISLSRRHAHTTWVSRYIQPSANPQGKRPNSTNFPLCKQHLNDQPFLIMSHHPSNQSPIPNPYEQTGLAPGLAAARLGFVCPHPFATPSSVSSTAALKAAPQLASLRSLSAQTYTHSMTS